MTAVVLDHGNIKLVSHYLVRCVMQPISRLLVCLSVSQECTAAAAA